jgi:hypothetical protein
VVTTPTPPPESQPPGGQDSPTMQRLRKRVQQANAQSAANARLKGAR